MGRITSSASFLSLSVNKKDGGTELSRYVWKFREQGKDAEMHWEVLKRCQPYRSGKRVCGVCNTEKLQILRHMGLSCVNLRSELNNKCLHARKHKLEKAGRATRK